MYAVLVYLLLMPHISRGKEGMAGEGLFIPSVIDLFGVVAAGFFAATVVDEGLLFQGGDVALEVAPGDTRVVRITPVTPDAATLISVSRHLSQGGYEMETFRSDASGASGAVKCPGGETVKVTLLLPERHGRIEASHPYDIDGRVLRLKLAPPAKETVAWHVAF